MFITLKFAQSLDGKIATFSGDSKWISSSESLKFAHYLRSQNDAILVGINTIFSDDPMLNIRLKNLKNKSLKRIILDRNLKIKENFKVIKTAFDIETIIFCDKLNIEDDGFLKKKEFLEDKNIKIFFVKSINEFLDISEIINVLKKEFNIKNLLVEGGSKILTNFYENNFFDKIFVIISPFFIGKKGINCIDFCGNSDINILKKNILNIKSVIKKDVDIILELEKKDENSL